MSDPFGPNAGRAPGSHRPVSVTLRQEGAGEPSGAAMLDPANQSLADALRITFRLLQVAMVVLFALYLLSGFQAVGTGERGIRLLFGRVTADDLKSGLRYSLPKPFGELIKVRTSATAIDITEQFWPGLKPEQKNLGTEDLANIPMQSLNPAKDGSLITGDGKLAHTRWSVRYARPRPSAYQRNINPEHEEQIVRAAVHRGAVRAVAEISIDDLMKQSGDAAGSVAARAQEVAQEMLDRLDSGLVIEQLKLLDKIPPIPVLEDFGSVQTAQAAADQKRQAAETEATSILNATAGEGSGLLRDLIGRYEAALAMADDASARGVRARIESVLLGQPVEIDGRQVEAQVSGETSTIISDATNYRQTVANARRAELSTFRAKLEAYQSNPRVMVVNEWSDTIRAFLSRDFVEQVYLPPGSRELQLVIDRDPEIVKRLETARRLRENQESEKAREEQRKQDRHKTDTERVKASS